MKRNIKLAFVFDGKAPELKKAEQERRRESKKDAQLLYDQAEKKGDIEQMKKYGGRTAKLTPEIIEESKALLTALGIPVIQAPSEGEAQAAHMAKQACFAAASQDYDSLLYGSPRLIRNLSIAGKRKTASALAYDVVKPEIVKLDKVLHSLAIDQDQLIILAILIGTDYNKGGVKGIGPKGALKLVQQHKNNFSAIFKDIEWPFEVSWEQVYDLVKHIPVTDNYDLKWQLVQTEQVQKLLVDEHDFALERVQKTLKDLEQQSTTKKQRSLGDFSA